MAVMNGHCFLILNGRSAAARCGTWICPARMDCFSCGIRQLDGIESDWSLRVLVARLDAVLFKGGDGPIVCPRADLSLERRGLAIDLRHNRPCGLISADHGTIHPVTLLGGPNC